MYWIIGAIILFVPATVLLFTMLKVSWMVCERIAGIFDD